MRITVLPHADAVTYYPDQGKVVMVRVTSYEFNPLVYPERFAAVHMERFLDITEGQEHLIDPTVWGPLTVISMEQATRIADFIKAHPDADEFVVHCDAGFSRSPAIAMAAADIHGLEATEFRQAVLRRRFAPNSTVYLRIAEAAGLRKKRQDDLEAVFGNQSPFI